MKTITAQELLSVYQSLVIAEELLDVMPPGRERIRAWIEVNKAKNTMHLALADLLPSAEIKEAA